MTHSLLSRHAAVVGAAVRFRPAISARRAGADDAGNPARERRRQLLGRPARRGRARCRRRGRLLPQCAQGRSAQSRTAQPRLSLRAHRRRHRRGRPSSPSGCCRSITTTASRGSCIGVRALKQKQYALARQNFAQSVRGPVTDLTATLLSAWALAGAGDTRAAVDDLDKLAGPDWYGIFKDLHAGAHPRSRQQQEGGRQALRARLQGRSDGAAHRGGLWPLSVAQRRQGRRAEDLSGFRQGAARPSADHRRDEGGLRRREAAAAGRFAAGRRRRGALRPRRLDRTPRRRGSGAHLSAACALSRAVRTRWRCCRSPISTRR